MRLKVLAAAAAVLGLWAVAGSAPAQAPGLSAEAASGAAKNFEARCKACHEPNIDRAPSREELAGRSYQSVFDALTAGSMKPMAAGLATDEISALAQYLTGKGPGAPPAAAGGGDARPARPAPAGQPDAVACKTNPPVQPGKSDWNGFGGDAKGYRYQPNPGLTAADTAKLKVKWAFSVTGGRYGQPSVIGEHLYVATGGGYVFDLDPATGCERWRYKLGGASRTSPVVAKVGGAWLLFVGDGKRDVFALDAATGKEVWKVNVESHPRAVLTGGANYADGVVYVPVSSLEEVTATIPSYGCCTFSGAVVALDAKTGKQLWKTNMLPKAQPTRKNSAGTQMFGPAGAAIWSQPTVDAAKGRVYVATGDSYTEVVEKGSDSITALDTKTGRIVWQNQVTEEDNFLVGCNPQRPGLNCPLGKLGPDHDFGASPIIATAPGGKQVILSGQKSGMAYGMDPATGKKLWENKVGAGSALGGIEWGMSYDGKRLFASVSDVIVREGAKPGAYAIDPLTGKTVWSAPAPAAKCSFKAGRCSNAHSAPPSSMPGVVFTGSHDGWVRALDSATGKMIWQFDTAGQTYQTVNGVGDQPGASVDAVGPVIAGGRMFVISGYSGATGAQGNPRDVLIAFEPAK